MIWPGRIRSVKLENYFEQMIISELLKEPYTGERFPGYENINHDFGALEVIFRMHRPDWKAALENVKGVYLIADRSNGKKYVGSAYGDAGVWARWSCYMGTGHGGNDELTTLIDREGLDYARRNFRISLLEYRPAKTDDKVFSNARATGRRLSYREASLVTTKTKRSVTMNRDQTLNAQTVGNVGLYYVCYHPSLSGWNVMPTARNARGVDILAYSQDAARTHAIQVKALSRHSPVPLGSSLDRFFGDFVVICRNVLEPNPESFVLTPEEVRRLAHRGEKDGRVSYWLQPKDYEQESFREAWHRIGSGLPRRM